MVQDRAILTTAD